eukprot:TRINITY_DN3230_c0_g1_i1.p1 TRINITY_DN3230_c0_g1~~TRINITY_DN3230_c0_g1_i1.p1  ORF type:complete len:262 (+),score=21.74 TRINITY_DN3230_c0_g1_i1:63-848(+)
MQGLKAGMRNYFLPVGYPNTVAPEYAQYQFWDTLQGLCQYLKGILTTLAVLKGFGVGNSDVALTSAMMCWLVRDLVAMISGLLAGHPQLAARFRANVPVWRLFSEVASSVSGLLSLLSASQNSNSTAFLLLISLASLIGAVGGVAGGCTRAVLMIHFARANNTADCAAKEGNQDRGVKLVGIFFAYYFLRAVGDDPALSWLAFAVLSVLHIFCNIRAVSVLRLPKAEPALCESSPTKPVRDSVEWQDNDGGEVKDNKLKRA